MDRVRNGGLNRVSDRGDKCLARAKVGLGTWAAAALRWKANKLFRRRTEASSSSPTLLAKPARGQDWIRGKTGGDTGVAR